MIHFKCASSGSSGNCYSLNDDGKIFLLDAGIPLTGIKRLVKWVVRDISGCFISHEHLDHSLSSDKLKNMGIPVFEPYKGGSQSFKSNGWQMKSFELPHDDVENRGIYLISPSGHRILYMTDFSFCKYTFTKLKVQTILIECNHMDDIDEGSNENKFCHVVRGHSSLSTVCEFLRVNQTDELKTVILCHLSETNADESEMLRQVQAVVGNSVNVHIAKKGVEIEL